MESGVFAKDKEIKKEVSKLKKIFGDLEGRNKEVSLKLIDEAAFLAIEMRELKQHVKEFGSVDEMEQGEYTILRTSPYYKNYLDAAKTYTTIFKQLLDLYPKGDGPKVNEVDELQSFLKKHNK